MIPRRLAALIPLLALLGALGLALNLGPVALAAPTTEEVNRVTEDARRELMAPCCWKDTLLNHSSPRSDELSAEVRVLAEQGMNKDQILETFAERYGDTILASPRTEGLGLLFYVIPALLLLVTGIWLGARVVPRLSTPSGPGGAVPPPPRAPEPGPFDARFEEELRRDGA